MKQERRKGQTGDALLGWPPEPATGVRPVGPLMGQVTGVSELGEHLPSGLCPALVRAAPPAVIPPPFLANVEQLPRQEGGESRRREMPSAST